MTDLTLERDDPLNILRGKYVESPRDTVVREDIDMLLANRAINCHCSNPASRMGLLLTGDPGAGKTSLLTRLISRYPALQGGGENDLGALVLRVESPVTLKSLALQILRALGLPVQGMATRADYWVDARFHLRENGVRLLWLDEAQHVFETASDRHSVEIISTLKNMMADANWPIVLVLSGPPQLEAYCMLDRQLKRRLFRRRLDPITASAHGGQVERQLREYCSLAGLSQALPADFIGRLLHATSGNLGMTFELIVDAIQEALFVRESRLLIDHFARAYLRQNDCPVALNIFLAEDWPSIVVGAPAEPLPKVKSKSKKTRREGIW